MGRIKTTLIKRNTRKLMENYGKKLTTDFKHNKKVVAEVTEIPSKKLRKKLRAIQTSKSIIKASR